jgi:hypothetical protein
MDVSEAKNLKELAAVEDAEAVLGATAGTRSRRTESQRAHRSPFGDH